MYLIPEIEASHDEIKALRRTIHAHPELRYKEMKTSQLVADSLERWGLKACRGLGKTGVVGELTRGTSSRCVGLRADMDALPITENKAFGHRSQNPGCMHACGHDGHAAMPHVGCDPVFAAVQIANGLQAIITRNKKPLDTAVLSITQIHGGDAVNVVRNEVWLGGTVRTFTVETLDLIE
ncbi:N-acetyldiaminopimelate deacetylase [Paraburkholderia nemoris]|uniref:N-acetyldiaminopimelate deacetylase n=1 Tax=Paraburkholderia nemoris TaxID=2793076 RepID=A0ABM8QYR8_9BURK|nr:N-acetyldiaminopimelate deacetylase [Paraburkholderia nemoris]CAE6749230.1 N-acetyldiaminopimelate deacetylase [Paraburkholderia nemoris]